MEDRRQPPLEEEEEGDSRQCVHRRMPPHMRVRCSDAWFVYCFLFKGRTQKKRVRNRETCGAQNIRNVKKYSGAENNANASKPRKLLHGNVLIVLISKIYLR